MKTVTRCCSSGAGKPGSGWEHGDLAIPFELCCFWDSVVQAEGVSRVLCRSQMNRSLDPGLDGQAAMTTGVR